jgi:hypothetical protein
MRSFIICTLYQILLGSSNQEGWAGHVAYIGAVINAYKILVTKPGRRFQFEDLGMVGG